MLLYRCCPHLWGKNDFTPEDSWWCWRGEQPRWVDISVRSGDYERLSHRLILCLSHVGSPTSQNPSPALKRDQHDMSCVRECPFWPTTSCICFLSLPVVVVVTLWKKIRELGVPFFTTGKCCRCCCCCCCGPQLWQPAPSSQIVWTDSPSVLPEDTLQLHPCFLRHKPRAASFFPPLIPERRPLCCHFNPSFLGARESLGPVRVGWLRRFMACECVWAAERHRSGFLMGAYQGGGQQGRWEKKER